MIGADGDTVVLIEPDRARLVRVVGGDRHATRIRYHLDGAVREVEVYDYSLKPLADSDTPESWVLRFRAVAEGRP